MISYREKIADILAPQIEGLEKDEIMSMIETPADIKMGDYAFPCFKLAKLLRKAPPVIAKSIAEAIGDDPMFEKVESVNAYVNMFVSKEDFAREVVSEAVEKGDDYGRSSIGGGKKVIVEYSSPNIAKPFHIGHIRSTVIGNSIYKIYDFLGYDTMRINHLGDYGTQFGKMICAYRRWGNKEDVIKEPIKSLLSYYTKFHVEAEKDPALEDEARAIFAKLEKGEPEEVELWQWFRDESLKEFNRVYDMLGITFDSYNGESFYSDKMPRFVQELKDKGLLVEDAGAQIVKLDEYDLPPALITKSDGSTLYITRDIAAAVYRKETYDFYKNIYVVASQQNLHFQQWIKVIELLGYDWAKDCVHVPFGLVSMEEGTMSTRQGRVIFLEDVLNRAVEQTRQIIKEKNVNTENIDETAKEVGIGAVVFNELSNYRIKDYVFSWDKVLNFEGETGPYVQYTHARACSILRNAGDDAVAKARAGFDAKYITSESAHRLMSLIYELPEVIVEAGEKYEPSIVTRHIVDISQAFNKFYHDEHILVDNEDEKIAKIALVLAAKTAIKNGLGLLGMKAPEKM
ncbi:Arginine--tRNA ligase [uncultured Eubacterium sp.]|uniref:arginine--tRNA ligase n=1 Tax=Brotomerdimonas butyrica TaxID=2981721 RepID=UPI0008232663|nr:arginine--tRNA ligase [Brotomerdimonas butyrica]MCU6755994.1 arginine--tRNA ligase [Brotomerdimonas butyrica]SCH60133.1 Arginine--tRNA ligase [uncultured Eubacterium sp.]